MRPTGKDGYIFIRAITGVCMRHWERRRGPLTQLGATAGAGVVRREKAEKAPHRRGHLSWVLKNK